MLESASMGWDPEITAAGIKVLFVLVCFHSEDLNWKFSRLNVSHSGLVNDFWELGKNERSLRYIQRCLQTLPAYCTLGPEGTPITWSAMDATSEIVMGYTLERYRNKGIMRR